MLCKKVCEKVEQFLRKQGIYSANWIRPEVSKEIRKDNRGRLREINFTSLGLDYQGEPIKDL